MNQNKSPKVYQAPVAEIRYLSLEDVITTSDNWVGWDTTETPKANSNMVGWDFTKN